MDQTEMYAKMYAMVVCAVSDAIDALEAQRPQCARKLLADALNRAEESVDTETFIAAIRGKLEEVL